MKRERALCNEVRRHARKVGRAEIDRRREVVAKTLKVRSEIGPIKTKAADLVRASREDGAAT